MIRKLLLTSIVILILAAFIASPALAAKRYFAEQYDVYALVQPDGTLTVTETVRFRFEGGSFSYVFRELSTNNLDAIGGLQASMDGQVLPEGTGAGQVEIAAGRPIKVTWHFPPTSDAAHTFTLTYQVRGAIRHDAAADTLIWRAIPEEHEYAIQKSVVTIEYPPGVEPLNTPTLNRTSAQPEMSGSAISFTLNELDEDEPVDISVHFPSGSLVDGPPAWQAAQEQRARQIQAALPYGLAAAGLTGILGLTAVFLLNRGLRREDPLDVSAPSGFTSPPASIAPALAARLSGSATPFLGTLFNLAQRGFLRIEEGPRKWGSRTFEIVRQPQTGRLSSHEQAFIDALFRKTDADRVNMSKIASLSSDRQYTEALEEELKMLGWRDPQRSQQRSKFMVWMVVGLLFGLLVLAAGFLSMRLLPSPEPTAVTAAAPLIMIGIGAALTIIGLVGLIVASLASTLTGEGIRQAASWNSFTGNLRNITRGREPAVSADLFERYLPYAAAFGMATGWAKFFQKSSSVPVPDWFQGLQTGFDDGSFIAVMAAISSADSSASSSSSGGAGGASGGGASGAG